MRRYSVIHPLFMSFYSKFLYQDVGKNWRGISFIYLLLLLAVCWIPGIVQVNSGISEFVTESAPGIVKQIPIITVSQGEVSVDGPEPYYIHDPERGDRFFILDTTGQITSLEGTDAKILLTKTKLIIEKNESETRIFDLSEIDGVVVDQALVNSLLEIISKWLAIILYPIVLVFSYLYRIIQALIYAAIGILIAKMVHADLQYESLVSLAIISITPVLILDTIVSSANIVIPLWNIICFIIAMGFLFFAVKANAQEEIENPDSPVPAIE